jgi:hypothetical protein
MAPDPLQTAGY